jgi:hypothetical protein
MHISPRKTYRLVAAALTLAACNRAAPPNQGPPEKQGVSAVRQALDSGAAAITKKWMQLGGAAVVGNPTSAVQPTPGGRFQFQAFQHGVIVDSLDFGAVLLTQQLFDKWISLQGQKNVWGTDIYALLGAPTGDFKHVNADVVGGHDDVAFEAGIIIAETGGNVRVVYGAIYKSYAVHGGIGLPTNEESGTLSTGRSQSFTGGEIQWSKDFEAFALTGPILVRWHALGGTTGKMGPPTSDVEEVTAAPKDTSRPPNPAMIGHLVRFKNGVIFDGQAAGVNAVTGDLLTEYETKYGGPAGWLGFPIGEEGTASGSGDPFVDFEHGILVNHQDNDAYHGIQSFGSLDFRLTRIEGHGDDCILCGSQDTYSHITLKTAGGQVGPVYRRPSSGDWGGGHDLTEGEGTFALADPPAVAVANSTFTVDAKVDLWDADDLSGDDLLGVVRQTYSIDNLWGAMIDARHRAGEAAAYFTVRSHHPFDLSDKKGQMWWSFRNFTTPNLTYDQFSDTFADVDPDELVWVHPFNRLYYELAYKGISKNGNCFGMSLQSIYSEAGRTLYPEPIIDYFPDTQDGRALRGTDGAHQSMIRELNVKQGYQLGINMIGWVVAMFGTGMTHNPELNYTGSLALAALGDHPLISLTDDFLFGGGHSVRPYAWGEGACKAFSGPRCLFIKILDSNFPKGVESEEDSIEIEPITNRYKYRNYAGGQWTGGRLFFQPYRLFNSEQYTPFANTLQLIEDGMMVLVGSDGKTNQVTDDSGRTLFEPGLTGPPTRWDQIRQDDATRIPNLTPLITVDSGDAMPMQMYYAKGVGATHSYDLVLAPGAAAGTPVEATFQSGKLSAYVKLPGTPGKPDRITAQKIGDTDKAISVAIAADGQSKAITWTMGGAEKQRWAELTNLNMAPGQQITAKVLHAGYGLSFNNSGPATTATLRTKAGPGSTPVVVGTISIPNGSSTTEYERPITTLATSGEVPGSNGWLVAPVTITLSAADLSGAGIDHIEYSRDQANWTVYAGPFAYGDQGTTTLYFRAKDKALNVEVTKSRQFKIDTLKPTASGTLSTSAGVKLTYSVTDPTPGSGPAGVHALVKGASGPTDVFTAGASGTVTLPTTCSALEFWGQDLAGLAQTTHVVLGDNVPPTFSSVPATVQSTHCTSAGGLVIGSAAATDDCGSVTVTNDAPSKFPLGTTIVTWTARDTAGNTKTVTQKVVVSLDDDASCCPPNTRVIKGTSASETLVGTSSNECILGLGGNDTIQGGGGFDFIAGGSGDDNITGGAQTDYIWGGAGRDVIDAREGNDFIDGGSETDNCSGSTGTNAIMSCEATSYCNAACCSSNSCVMTSPGPLGCQTAYAQSSCTSYVLGTTVSKSGHNWECTNGNCANCVSYSSCAPGGSGCPWGTVWTDRGTCP